MSSESTAVLMPPTKLDYSLTGENSTKAIERGLAEAELFKYLLLRPATVWVPSGDERNHDTLESIRAGRPTNNAGSFLAWPKLGMCGQSVLVHGVSTPAKKFLIPNFNHRP